MRQQPRKCPHVIFAIIEDSAALALREWRPVKYAVPRCLFTFDINPVIAEVPQGAAYPVKSFLPLAALDRPVVHVVAEFDVGIEATGGLAPS
jgi:hypothetical protein